MDEDAVRAWLKGVLRAEMARRGIGYAGLAERLRLVDVEIDERTLRNKIARGTFSAVFFTECLIALGVDALEIDALEQVVGPEEARVRKDALWMLDNVRQRRRTSR
jgi:hypothetical protein